MTALFFKQAAVNTKGVISVNHPFPPVFDRNSEILILGSFPSVRSREEGFFYGHPRNRFWSVLAAVYGEDIPVGIDGKRAFLLKHRIALWDVISSCEIKNSADGSVRGAVANDLSLIFETADIKRVYTNGKLAYSLYEKHIDKNAVYLPSTSPANAAWSIERLIDAWRVIRDA